MIHQYREDGLSISEIARRMGIDRKTVRKHLNQGLTAPVYGPRRPSGSCLDAFKPYLKEKIELHPGLSAKRLMRDIAAEGYTGSYSTLTDYIRTIRPVKETGYEHRFETPPGYQAQVDFAQFRIRFKQEPELDRVIWLFTMILGCSRFLFGQFVWRQTLDCLVRCHIDAFEAFGGVPKCILYDRMKTAVIGDSEPGVVIYNPTLLSLAGHYGFAPRACAPYRAKTKGKVERPYRYIRQDFFLDSEFDDMTELNRRFQLWCQSVAHVRTHGTTGRVVHQAFEEEQPFLQTLPAGRFNEVLALDRRVTRDGMVSVDGNLYSVPDTRKVRHVTVERTATQVRIVHEGELLALHPLLKGRGQRSVQRGHRRYRGRSTQILTEAKLSTITGEGDAVTQRPLDIYQQIGERLSAETQS